MKPSLKLSPLQALTGCRSDLPAKIAELEDCSVRVHKQILGLDVTVTHTLGVDVGQAPEELVHVHLGWAGHSSTAAPCFPQSTLYGPHYTTVPAGCPTASAPELL